MPKTLEGRVLLSTTVPALLAITRATPARAATGSASTTYAVAFNEPVTGVTAADFQLAGGNDTAAASALLVSPMGSYQSVYAVTVNNSTDTSGLNLVMHRLSTPAMAAW